MTYINVICPAMAASSKKEAKKNQLYEDVGLHYICKHKGLFHPSLLWQPFLLNTTLGKKETRSSNLCLEIKH